MAMIICSECGTEISDQSDNCIKCGANLNSLALVEKIKENRQNTYENDIQNSLAKHSELIKQLDKKNNYSTFRNTIKLIIYMLVIWSVGTYILSICVDLGLNNGGFLILLFLFLFGAPILLEPWLDPTGKKKKKKLVQEINNIVSITYYHT